MGSIFINQDETIKVNIWVGEDSKNKTRYWSREVDRPKDALSATKYEVVFRKPNFRDSTVLLDLGVRMNVEGGMDLAFNEIRYRRLEILLKSWTLKDADGKAVPANANAIGNLHPTFAMVLAGALERELGVEEGMFEDGEETETEQEDGEKEDNPEDSKAASEGS
tara:strand:+ start:14948 stop:15442 length:495 start_codon:yes stop_codon:yes gene_type:complete